MINFFDISKPHISRDEIQTILGGIKPKNLDNYRKAFVHESFCKYIKLCLSKKVNVCSYYLNENGDPESNERLEFLGDSVLNLIITDYIFEKYSTKDEGFLTILRTKLVRDTFCVKFSKLLGLQKYILLGNFSEIISDKILEDVFEAFLGALYLDLGPIFTKHFMVNCIEKHVDFSKLTKEDNYKDTLMRYIHSKGLNNIEYLTTYIGKVFTTTVCINISGIEHKLGSGKGTTKKKSEQVAAKNVLKKINDSELIKIIERKM